PEDRRLLGDPLDVRRRARLRAADRAPWPGAAVPRLADAPSRRRRGRRASVAAAPVSVLAQPVAEHRAASAGESASRRDRAGGRLRRAPAAPAAQLRGAASGPERLARRGPRDAGGKGAQHRRGTSRRRPEARDAPRRDRAAAGPRPRWHRIDHRPRINHRDRIERLSMSVCAVICTYNKRELLLECLDALTAQTRPLERVIIVDNASTDGTLDAVENWAASSAVSIGYIELAENAGASGGFAEAIAQAVAERHEWVWVIDNDCMPAREALARLIGSPQAADPDTVALCTTNRSVYGHIQTEYRGLLVHGQPAPLPESAYAADAVRLDFAAFAGLLVRAEAIREVGAPKPEFFLWVEDLEWCIRL